MSKELREAKREARKRAKAERKALRQLPLFAEQAVVEVAKLAIPGPEKRQAALRIVADLLDQALGGRDGEHWRGLLRILPAEAVTDALIAIFFGRITEAVDAAYDKFMEAR